MSERRGFGIELWCGIQATQCDATRVYFTEAYRQRRPATRTRTRGGCRADWTSARAVYSANNSPVALCRRVAHVYVTEKHSGVQLLPPRTRVRISSNTTPRYLHIVTRKHGRRIGFYAFSTFPRSVDVRGKPVNEGRHWSAPTVFGERAKFMPDSEPDATLELAVSTTTWDFGLIRISFHFCATGFLQRYAQVRAA